MLTISQRDIASEVATKVLCRHDGWNEQHAWNETIEILGPNVDDNCLQTIVDCAESIFANDTYGLWGF